MNGPAATILIVDDEIQNHKVLEALLRPEGHLILSATGGEEALVSIARRPPDLILLDIMMPGMDGYQVAKVLKSDPVTMGIPIIMVTALADRRARLAGLDAGAQEFLTKPVDRSELWLRVRNLLRLKAFDSILERMRERSAVLQRFRTAMDAAGDAILLLSRGSMRFVEVNATATGMLGYSREEFLEMGPRQLAACSREHLERCCDALIADPARGSLAQLRVRCKDGTKVQVEVQRHAQRIDSEWIIVAVMRDIAARTAIGRSRPPDTA